MPEKSLADSSAYWDYLRDTTAEIFATELWAPSRDGSYEFRVKLAPEDQTGDTLFILNQARTAVRESTWLTYRLTPYDASHNLLYSPDQQTLEVTQKVGRVIPPLVRALHPMFKQEVGELQPQPTTEADHKLLARGLTRLQRYGGNARRAV